MDSSFDWNKVTVVTPSKWSASGLEARGVPQSSIFVLPHGFDPLLFKPFDHFNQSRVRQQAREARGWPGNCVVFLSIGSMYKNKNVENLVRAFIQVHSEFPHTKLVLKGQDSLYQSKISFETM